jgi:phospholipid/cholesterol/gamma-HCH transport system substrate-binding protein
VLFGQYRSGSTNSYSAVFDDISRLKTGDSVRVSGMRAGSVTHLALRPDNTVLVSFDADRDVAITTGTRAAVRYLNLVGDRYLELLPAPGPVTAALPAGAQIPVDHTAPALDLDLLLGGLKPLVQGLNPSDVNALSASLIEIFQGQGATLQSLFAKTASFTSTLADHNNTIEALIDHLRQLLATLSKEGTQFSGTIDRLDHLVGQLAADRDPIGAAINSLAEGTASLTDLLSGARPPLAATIDQLNRLAPILDEKKDRIETSLSKAPQNYRKLARAGSYGSFVNFYLCGLAVRTTDLQGRTAVFPWFKQETGRCAEP